MEWYFKITVHSFNGILLDGDDGDLSMVFFRNDVLSVLYNQISLIQATGETGHSCTVVIVAPMLWTWHATSSIVQQYMATAPICSGCLISRTASPTIHLEP